MKIPIFNFVQKNNYISPIKNTLVSSPLKFKGSFQQDSFESSSASKKDSSFDKLQEKINESEKIASANELELESCQQELNTAEKQYNDAFNSLKEAEDKLDEQEIRTREQEINELISKVSQLRRKKNELQSIVLKQKQYTEVLKESLKAKKTSSEIAFLSDSNLNSTQKETIRKEKNIPTTIELSKELGIPVSTLTSWEKDGTISITKYKSPSGGYIIDIFDEKNANFLNYLKEKIPTCMLAETLQLRYNMGETTFKKHAEDGDFEIIGHENLDKAGVGPVALLIDMEDEKTIATLNEHKKLHPMPVNKKEISAALLKKLGFGDLKTIRQLVQNGHIKGRIEEVETEKGLRYKTFVDVHNYASCNVLEILRNRNPNITDIGSLAKELKITQPELKEAIKNGELEIISHYVISKDYNKIFIDKTTPKNSEYITKIEFENQILEELDASKKEEIKKKRIQGLNGYNKLQSLRLRLVWANMPRTKAIGSELAKDDGYLRTLLEKESSGEKLSDTEAMKVNSYRKNMWTQAGTEEFTKAYKIANEYLSQYQQGGLKAVQNEEAKEIISQYFKEESEE